MDHLTALEDLTSALADLDMVQSWIDNARVAAPTNELVQTKLDLQQIDLNYKRARIEAAMKYIRNTN